MSFSLAVIVSLQAGLKQQSVWDKESVSHVRNRKALDKHYDDIVGAT